MKDTVNIDGYLVREDGSRARFLLNVSAPFRNKRDDWETMVWCPCTAALTEARPARGATPEQAMSLGLFFAIECLGGFPKLEDKTGHPVELREPRDLDLQWDDYQAKS